MTGINRFSDCEYNILPSLDGGKSSLGGIEIVFEKKFMAKVRMGRVNTIDGIPESDLMYCVACIGGVKYYINKKNNKLRHRISRQNQTKNSKKGLTRFFKDFD